MREALAFQWCAHGARTAKRLRTAQGRNECFSIGAEHPIPPPSIPPIKKFKKFSRTPLRTSCGFGILSPSADEPGSRKERDDLVFLEGGKEKE
jgi:hypothetical protein